MLYFIGIGLKGLSSISKEGYEIAQKCNKVYLEGYTSVLLDKEGLVKDLKAIELDREGIEQKGDEIVQESKNLDVCVLIIGDVFGATTHTDLFMRSKDQKVEVRIIGGESILSAVGIVGLSLYKFGKVASIPFEHENVKTAAECVKFNLDHDMHSLVLLDLDPIGNKFLKIEEGVKYLIKNKVISSNDNLVGCARIGWDDQKIRFGKSKDLKSFGKPPYCILIPSKNPHFMEEEALELWK